MKKRHLLAAVVVATAAIGSVGHVSAQKSIIQKAPINGVIKGVPAPVVPLYRFSVDSFVITETRSLHEDTDTVAAEVVGPNIKPPRKLQQMGDVNNGTYAVGLSVDASLSGYQYLDFTYTIFNEGSGVLEEFMNESPLGLLIIPGIAFANCDGVVAAGKHHFIAMELEQQTAGGQVIRGQDYSPGTDSDRGCGSNSKYYVSWSVSRVH